MKSEVTTLWGRISNSISQNIVLQIFYVIQIDVVLHIQVH